VERARDVLDPHEDAALERLLERCVAEVPTYSWLNRASFFLEGTVRCRMGRLLDRTARPLASMQWIFSLGRNL
jgi:hypothetical protein